MEEKSAFAVIPGTGQGGEESHSRGEKLKKKKKGGGDPESGERGLDFGSIPA